MKKILLHMLLAVVVAVIWTTDAQAEGEIEFPNISHFDYYYDYGSNYSYSYFLLKDAQSEESILVSDSGNLKIINASDGTVIRSFDSTIGYGFTANDANTYFVTSDSDALTIFDHFGETVFKEREIPYKDEDFKYFNNVAFIPNTNTLVMTSNDATKLLGFNVDQQQGVFSRNITQGTELAVSSQYIALSGSTNQVTILDTKGVYITTIEADMNVNLIEFTDDEKKLVVGGDSNQLAIYDVNKDFEKLSLTATQFALDKNGTFNSIDIDATGKYLIAEVSDYYVTMFDFQTGQRIYTNLDNMSSVNVNTVEISSGGKYILVNGNVYDGKNIKKRVIDIAIPKSYQTLQLGTKNKLKLQATLANGTEKEITSGVDWATSAFNIAYLDANTGQLVTKKTGSVDLKASYLGLETTTTVNVIDTKAPKLTGVADKTIYVGSNFSAKTGVKAIDAGEGDLTNKIKVSGTVNSKKSGTYKLTYTVTDSSGNNTKATRTIKVKKNPKNNYNYYYDGISKVHAHKNVYTTKGTTKYKYTFVPVFYEDSFGKELYMFAEIKTKNPIKLKKVIMKVNGKQYAQNVKSYTFEQGNDEGEYTFFTPKTGFIKFMEQNVTTKNKVTIQYVGSKKTLTYTLNSKQKQAVLDGLEVAGK